VKTDEAQLSLVETNDRLSIDTAVDWVSEWPGEQIELTDGTRVHVRHAAATHAGSPTAVVVHGLGGSAHNWTDFMANAREFADTWAIDLPGFGESDPPRDGDYSPAAHARAVIAFIEHLGGQPVHLAGNSLGGAVSVIVTATRPDLVATLTLVSPALPDLRPRLWATQITLMALPGVGEQLQQRMSKRYAAEQRVRGVIALCFGRPDLADARRADEAVNEMLRRDEMPWSGEAVVRSGRSLVAAYFDHNADRMWNLVARISVPTLAVYGRRDRLVRAGRAARIARSVPGSRVLLLPECGHVAQMEEPVVVARAMRDLVASTVTV
jgi:pimeloyl-ACP methyl ester carboxylesterase